MHYICFWEWFCSREDFQRHSLTALLGGSELRALTPYLYLFGLCSHDCTHHYSFSKVVLNTASPTIWGCPHIASLEEQPLKKAWLGWDGVFNGCFNHPKKPHLSRKLRRLL